jgi:hypothetical protein
MVTSLWSNVLRGDFQYILASEVSLMSVALENRSFVRLHAFLIQAGSPPGTTANRASRRWRLSPPALRPKHLTAFA